MKPTKEEPEFRSNIKIKNSNQTKFKKKLKELKKKFKQKINLKTKKTKKTKIKKNNDLKKKVNTKKIRAKSKVLTTAQTKFGSQRMFPWKKIINFPITEKAVSYTHLTLPTICSV